MLHYLHDNFWSILIGFIAGALYMWWIMVTNMRRRLKDWVLTRRIPTA